MRGLVVIGAACLLASCQDPSTRLPESSMPNPLVPGQVRDNLVYSPDGTRLAWWQTPTDSTVDQRLWVGNADFSGARMLPVTSPNGDPPIWSPDGTRLVVLTAGLHMALVPVDGGDVVALARGPGVQIPVGWHPDGDHVSYIGSGARGSVRTFAVSVSTGKSSPLIPGATLPHFGTWSPDGSMIAYGEIDGERRTIWLADSTGGNRRQLTTEGFEGIERDGWSPDGKSLLYVSNRTGKSDLWSIPVDGGPPRQLTRDIANDDRGVWSRDGRWVAFISDRGRQTDVWVVSDTGGEARRVSDSKQIESMFPVWRPGTHELLFTDYTSRRNVTRIDVADGTERDLLGDSLLVDEIELSRDGRQVAVVVGRGGGSKDLLVVPSDGGASRAVVTAGGNIFGPQWSPDGSMIAYTSDLRGTTDVFVVEVASAAVRPITDWPGYEGSPAWDRTGSSLYFNANRGSRLNDIWAVPATGGEPRRVTRVGGVGAISTGAGVAEFVAQVIGQRAGELGIARLEADHSIHTIYDRSNAYLVDVSPLGDSLVIMAEQANGADAAMLVPIRGGAGRVILAPNLNPLALAPDGRRLIYGKRVGPQTDLGIVDLRDGSTRELTHSPQSEVDTHWLPDGKAIVTRRGLATTRVIVADLSSITGAKE